jgi:hypothetical protein
MKTKPNKTAKMKKKVEKKNICEYCGKPIPTKAGIYIAGSICEGHRLSLLGYLLKLLRNVLGLSPCCGARVYRWDWDKYYCRKCGKRI